MKNAGGLIRFIKGMVLALLLIAAAANTGISAPGGSQTVTVAAAANIDITVPGASAIASTAPGACGTTSSVIHVRSNKIYNLQIRSEPVAYPNGKASNGTAEMVNAFQYGSAGAGPWTNITSAYANVFANQAKTSGLGVDHTVWYQQCVDWSDDPGSYTIVVEYLGVQP